MKRSERLRHKFGIPAGARAEYGLSDAEVASVGRRLRKDLARERKAGTIRSVLSIVDLKG